MAMDQIDSNLGQVRSSRSEKENVDKVVHATSSEGFSCSYYAKSIIIS